MIHLAVTLFALLGMAGVVLNTLGRRSCFLAWTLSNGGFVLVDLCHTKLYERAALHGAYLVSGAVGWWVWGRKEAGDRAERQRLAAEAELWQARYDRLLGACAELRAWVEQQGAVQP